MPKFEFVAEANVQPAVSGMQKLQAELGKTAIAGAKADSALAKSSTALGKTLPAGANQATNALTNLGRVVQDAPFGFIGIANNINPLLESFQRLKVETGSTKLAFQSLGASLLGPAGLGIAVSVASSLLTVFAQQALSKSGNEAEDASKKVKKYADVLQEIVQAAGKEATEVTSLIAVLKSETETRVRKLGALEELKKIQPEIFGGLKLEKDAVIGLDEAYKAYLLNFKNVIAAKLIQAEIEKKITKVLELQGAAQTKDQQQATERLRKYVDSLQNARNLIVAPSDKGRTIFQQQDLEVKALEADIQDLIKRLSEVSNGIKVDAVKIKPDRVEIEKPERLTFFEPGLVKAGDLAISPKVVVTPKFEFFERDPNALKKALEEWVSKEKAKQIGEAFSSIINQTMQSAISSLADSLGNTLSGNGSFGDIFSGLYKVFGAGLKQLGQYLVKTYALIKAIEEVKFKNAAVGIAVGFALQILGATIEARVKSQNAFASGVRNFEGGFATVGERGQENIFLPRGSTVQPNNEVMAFGRGGITLMPSIAYDGTKFRLFLNEVDAKIGRNG